MAEFIEDPVRVVFLNCARQGSLDNLNLVDDGTIIVGVRKEDEKRIIILELNNGFKRLLLFILIELSQFSIFDMT